MKKKMFYPFLTIAILCIFSLATHAEMQSSNYKIPTSVFSSGGVPTGSTNYQTDSTLGQSSPLMDPSDPPLSSNFNRYPGFWPAAILFEFTEDLVGTVWFVGAPCAPGLPCQVPPGDGPYPNYEIIVYESDGVTIATQAYSDENGNYRIDLSPGDYIIYTPNGLLVQQSNIFTIVEGETTTLDLVIDIGIRSVDRLNSDVDIDIMPYSNNNSINLRRISSIPVAILSTSDFYASEDIDRSSLTFGRTGDERSLSSCRKRPKDVNNDGLPDLICLFQIKKTGFQSADTEGILKGLKVDGTPIEGTDSVKVMPGLKQARQ